MYSRTSLPDISKSMTLLNLSMDIALPIIPKNIALRSYLSKNLVLPNVFKNKALSDISKSTTLLNLSRNIAKLIIPKTTAP
jgi:hypothetical protein